MGSGGLGNYHTFYLLVVRSEQGNMSSLYHIFPSFLVSILSTSKSSVQKKWGFRVRGVEVWARNEAETVGGGGRDRWGLVRALWVQDLGLGAGSRVEAV